MNRLMWTIISKRRYKKEYKKLIKMLLLLMGSMMLFGVVLSFILR